MSEPVRLTPAEHAARRAAADAAACGGFLMPPEIRTERLVLASFKLYELDVYAAFSAMPTPAPHRRPDRPRRRVRPDGPLQRQLAALRFGAYTLSDRDGCILGYAGCGSRTTDPNRDRLRSAAGRARQGLCARGRHGDPQYGGGVRCAGPRQLHRPRQYRLAEGGEGRRRGAGGAHRLRRVRRRCVALPADAACAAVLGRRPHHRRQRDAARDPHAAPVAVPVAAGAPIRALPRIWRSGDDALHRRGRSRPFSPRASSAARRGSGTCAATACMRWSTRAEFVGSVGLYHPENWPQLELAYNLTADARGKGFATEAVSAVRDVAAAQGIRRLVSYIDPTTPPRLPWRAASAPARSARPVSPARAT